MEITIQKKVLEVNETMADKNRNYFREKGVFVLNMMSSPGSGKTETLCKTLKRIMPETRTGVIVGDICTRNDADRLEATGAAVVQINTDQFGGDCHLAAHLIDKAAREMTLDSLDLLIVENIGNLVCPAEFDIGENVKVVVLSVTEGEDKPLKYPLMFQVADAAILNKIDLLPYLDVDADLAVNNMKTVHPMMPVFKLSAKTEEGFDQWIEWLNGQIQAWKK
ncbi:Hydrogenase accessory protein HypB, Ni(2+)-binding GTPase, (NiFe)-hydrogenase/urease maturation factor [Desulfamplus magnetovallimortis]|uniref:Hydrogenase accessory protein HypB, Ni(2+)-binding GTPase, (NiFe)-hydrogenase/urease maturation factor n=1 Tax=Desulfamplus magnetovallimortis TaxID=1246637 RepID=A0A1W1H9Z1_9BACT|nr:hydrogenase nickel incorporation protein HypB [Desulfamplus magnetovallimortis]SLM29304.1 Hydrogenase accessory protein HypB, Ni(2+)-binding GTPase, (NiFe)-hydrogenase/urease maturation factor [Desulfamplus magnetovallimortis]